MKSIVYKISAVMIFLGFSLLVSFQTVDAKATSSYFEDFSSEFVTTDKPVLYEFDNCTFPHLEDYFGQPNTYWSFDVTGKVYVALYACGRSYGYMFVSNESFSMSITNPDLTVQEWGCNYSDSYGYYWSLYASGSNLSYAKKYGCSLCHADSPWDELFSSIKDSGFEGLLGDADRIPSDVDSAILNKDIGYVSSVRYKELVNNNGTLDDVTDDKVTLSYTWADHTTTGLLYSSGEYYVDVYFSMTGTYHTTPFGIGGSKVSYETPKMAYKRIPATNMLIKYTYSEQQVFMASYVDEFNEKYKKLTNGAYYAFNTYFRVVRKNADGTYEKGNFLKYGTKNADESNTVESVDEDGNPTGDNSEISDGSKLPTDHGEGDSDETADDNTITINDPSVSGDTLDNIKSILSGVGEVPKIISYVFSFLPSWCLGFVAAGFAVFVVLIVVKAVRG